MYIEVPRTGPLATRNGPAQRHRPPCRTLQSRENPQLRQVRGVNLTRESVVARVVVDVMLKPEILDPQGQAIARKLPQMGFAGITAVRQGKRFELELDGPVDEAALDRIRKIAETLLANPVIENYEVVVE